MSVKIMGQVWELDLPAEKLLMLLALADHADHTGGGVRPGVSLLMWKTSRSESAVRRMLGELRKDGILVPIRYAEGGRGRATEYRICLDAVPHKAAYHPPASPVPSYPQVIPNPQPNPGAGATVSAELSPNHSVDASLSEADYEIHGAGARDLQENAETLAPATEKGSVWRENPGVWPKTLAPVTENPGAGATPTVINHQEEPSVNRHEPSRVRARDDISSDSRSILSKPTTTTPAAELRCHWCNKPGNYHDPGHECLSVTRPRERSRRHRLSTDELASPLVPIAQAG